MGDETKENQLNQVLERNLKMIDLADRKAAISITYSAAMLGLTIKETISINEQVSNINVYLVFAQLLMVFGISTGFWAVFPRLKRSQFPAIRDPIIEILEKIETLYKEKIRPVLFKGKNEIPEKIPINTLYFEDIAYVTKVVFEAFVNSSNDHLVDQVYQTSRIASNKMRIVRYSILSALFSTLSITAILIPRL